MAARSGSSDTSRTVKERSRLGADRTSGPSATFTSPSPRAPAMSAIRSTSTALRARRPWKITFGASTPPFRSRCTFVLASSGFSATMSRSFAMTCPDSASGTSRRSLCPSARDSVTSNTAVSSPPSVSGPESTRSRDTVTSGRSLASRNRFASSFRIA